MSLGYDELSDVQLNDLISSAPRLGAWESTIRELVRGYTDYRELAEAAEVAEKAAEDAKESVEEKRDEKIVELEARVADLEEKLGAAEALVTSTKEENTELRGAARAARPILRRDLIAWVNDLPEEVK